MPAARDTATLTVTEPVDGTPRRRPPRPSSRSGAPVTTAVAPAALELARRLLRPGQRLRLESATVVYLENV